MPMPQLQAALMGSDGQTPAAITRIEIELLDTGRFRWTLWSGARRLHSLLGGDGDRPAMLEATDTIVRTELASRREGN